LTFDKSIVRHYVDDELPNHQRGYGITTKCSEEKAIKILKFMDVMLEEENQKKLYWGFEGEDYLIDKDGSVTGVKGQPYRTEKMRKEQKDPKWQDKNKALLWNDEAPKLEGTMPSGYNRSLEEFPYEQAALNAESPWDTELWAAYGVGSYKELMGKAQTSTKNAGWYPLWQLNPNAENGGAEADAKAAQVQFEDTWARKYLPQMIMCETDAEFEKLWAEYVAGIKPYFVTWNAYFQECLDDRVSKYGGLPE
jgi:putative aldouronate transport system substrate-binding protein